MSANPPAAQQRAGQNAPNAPVPLRAGPLTLLFENGDLRYIKFGEVEVIRRIYAAVRDRNWNTILGTLRNVRIDQGRDFFHITYESEHSEGDIAFVWRGEITGDEDGTIRFTFDGEARSTFLKNRIGFCVLHPIKECAGRPCEVQYANGGSTRAEFPRLVAAEQPVRDIHDLQAISHEIEPGLRAELRFEGDLFEMEDQRNWIDASYKTFCTPLRLPYPAEIKAEMAIQQAVTLRLIGEARTPHIETRERRAVEIVTSPERTFPLPEIGFSVSSYRQPYVTGRIAELRPAHLRVDLDLSTDWFPAFKHAISEANEFGAGLELALTFPEGGSATVADAVLDHRERIKRIAVFTKGAKSTTPATLALARKLFKDAVPIGVGTNADFYQLNQSRPPWQDADFVCWSMNPQVHAFDETSILETPEAVPAQIESAREYFRGKPLVVSPITLKPRFNPVATAAATTRANALPPEVDPRQRTHFAAAWAFAILKRLIEARVESVTFFETVGWRGVMEGDYRSPMPDLFPSEPGEVFPVHQIFRALADFKDGEAVMTETTDWRRVEALCLRRGTEQRLLAQNMTAVLQETIPSYRGGMLAPYQQVTLAESA